MTDRVPRCELWRLGIGDLLEGYRQGVFTPGDVLHDCATRISEQNHQLRALTEWALPEPTPFDAQQPLSGVPFAVKDLLDVSGQVTRAGSRVRQEHQPATDDAAVVRQLRRAGAMPIARAVTHEFAWGITSRHPELGGPVNPTDPTRVAGGSSGGSAVAVAAGMVPFSVGTDTAGSIRIPAAWCGLYGWKPNNGLVCADGVVPLAPSLDTVGFLTRSLSDLELLAELFTPLEATRRRLKLGVPAWFRPRLRPDIAGCFADVVRRANVADLNVVLLEGFHTDTYYEVFRPIQMAEALAVHRDVLGTWPSDQAKYGVDVAERLRSAETMPTDTVDIDRARSMLTLVPDQVDALLLPVAACGPSTVSDPDVAPGTTIALRDLVVPFNVAANLTGAASVVIPAGADRDGLPVGVQVVTPRGADAVAFSVARKLCADDVGEQAPLDIRARQ